MAFRKRLRVAAVAGRITVQREWCGYRDEQPRCESDSRRLSLAFIWEARGPVTRPFVYVRATREECEYALTGTQRSRDATAEGTIDGRFVRLDGEVFTVDLDETRVCQ
jgi:hypothetical protein